ncbi:MAG: YkvA family protein [Nitriliruptoraceae bacterium]
MAGPSRARQYLRGERDVRGLAAAAAPAGQDSHGLFADLAASWRLARAYLRGDYRAVRLRSVLAVLGGLLYFLSPVDLIPDVIALLGLTDDAIVLSLVFGVVRQELAGFRAWEFESSQLDVTVLSTVREG